MEYALPVWYKPVANTDARRPGTVWVAKALGKVPRLACKTITGALHTTASDTLDYHANLLPAHIAVRHLHGLLELSRRRRHDCQTLRHSLHGLFMHRDCKKQLARLAHLRTALTQKWLCIHCPGDLIANFCIRWLFRGSPGHVIRPRFRVFWTV